MILIISFILFNFLNPQKCIDLILNQKFKQAYELYISINKTDKSDEMRFLSAYYNRDSEQAVMIYENLYLNSKNSNVKYLSTKKLYEYYYAKGLYIKARNLKSSLDSQLFNKSAPVDNIKSTKYVLQCGVFGMESNALSLKEKIATIVNNKVYLAKDVINNQEVIRVFIGDINTYQRAENIKNIIDSKLSLNAMIKEIVE